MISTVGVVVNNFITRDSFIMGVLWFNFFILWGLLMRKLTFKVKFSVKPFILLLVLTVLRMVVVIELPEAITFTTFVSHVYYPLFVTFMRQEVFWLQVFGGPVTRFSIFVVLWVVVSAALVVRRIKKITNAFPGYRRIKNLPRDQYAETMLKDIIGHDKTVCVFRTNSNDMPYSLMIKPYIVLPSLEFSDEILRVILLHEWKHIEDKDVLMANIVDVVCYLFCWWNPLVHILRRNFSFARELKCDLYAVPTKNEFWHYMDCLHQLDIVEDFRSRLSEQKGSFLSDKHETTDRIKALVSARKKSSRSKDLVATVSSSVFIFAMFVASYMFLIQPAFWESPYIAADAGIFTGEPVEPGDEYRYFRLDEVFIVDNGDGTFSLYMDGVFVKNLHDNIDEFRFFPMRERNDGGVIQ